MAMAKHFGYTLEELEIYEKRSLERIKRETLKLNGVIEDYNPLSTTAYPEVMEIINACNAVLASCSHLRICARERQKRRSV